MGTSAVLSTIHTKGVVVGDPDKFNTDVKLAAENIGWDFDAAVIVDGITEPFVAEIDGAGEFCFLAGETDEPTNYAWTYGMFDIDMAKAISENITKGELILMHVVEQENVTYYWIRPNDAVEVDIVAAIKAFYP